MKGRKIIFLDIDGVLNNGCSAAEVETSSILELKRIIEATQAEIVISSQRRGSSVTMGPIKAAFEKYQLPLWIDETSFERIGFGLDRQLEILLWLRGKTDIENWIAIDDESNSILNPRNFRTRRWLGLTKEVADQAIIFLNKSQKEISLMQQQINSRYHDYGVLDAIIFNGEFVNIQWEKPLDPRGPAERKHAERTNSLS